MNNEKYIYYKINYVIKHLMMTKRLTRRVFNEFFIHELLPLTGV